MKLDLSAVREFPEVQVTIQLMPQSFTRFRFVKMLFRALPVSMVLISLAGHASVVALWNFNSPVPDGNETTGTLSPAIGAGVAVVLGGVTGTYTIPNGSSDPDTVDNSNWRITTWPAQSTQNKQNGVRFNVPTVGWSNLRLLWDLRNSNTASKYTRLQYTTNGIDFRDLQLVTMPFETWKNGQTASFVGVAGVENNPRFAFRFVTEFESTATGSGLSGYVTCNPTNVYGSAGTLRFDMVTLTGDPTVQSVSVLTYNVLGRDVPDWTTNSLQVQAIGRQLRYLKPDVIGFQEIPETNSNYLLMTNFVAAYLPDYFLGTGPRTDGGERSVVASRFPIIRSQSWLGRSDISAFGYAGVYTRDLFEAQIAVPGFDQPLHFFTTHLKAHPDQDSATRRGAEARAVSNFFTRVFLPANSLHPYVLVGDMNEDIYRPREFELDAINTMANKATGLAVTSPRNPFTGDERTWSIQNPSPTIRFDYVLPCSLLYENITSSQVFRSDRVTPLISPLQAGDSAAASDHMPVTMTFRNPYERPFSITRIERTNNAVKVTWGSVPGGRYRLEGASNLVSWAAVMNNITASGSEYTCQITNSDRPRFVRVAKDD
jgi:endonuclease/exonuclease/phosphatase family metal-dependent hydrolase